jgi:hypothetical protein
MTQVDDSFWRAYAPKDHVPGKEEKNTAAIWKAIVFAAAAKQLDAVDLALVIALSADSRVSIRTLAIMVDMSIGGIQKKLRKIRRVLGQITQANVTESERFGRSVGGAVGES